MRRGLLGWALVLAMACGGPETEDVTTEVGTSGHEVEAVAPPPLDPLALMPADSLTVTSIDVGRLRTSPYYPTLHGWLELLEELSPSQREAIDAAIASTEIAHVSVVNQPCSRKCWTLASVFLGGSMDPSRANATLQTLAEGASFGPREVAGHPAFGDEQGAVVTVEPGKYLVGPHEHLAALAQPRRPHAESVPAVAAAVQALAGGDDTIRGWIVGDATTQELIARETPFTSRVTSLVRGAAYRVDLANGLLIDLVATTADPASAATLADALRREVDGLTGGLAGRAMGIHVLGQATVIQVQGEQVRVTLQLSDEQVRPLLRRADGILRLVN